MTYFKDNIRCNYTFNFQKLIGQNHKINKKFSEIPVPSSDDEELVSSQSQLCHENNNEFSNPGYLFDDDLPEVSGRKKSNVTNECDVNFLPQQAKKNEAWRLQSR